jgi:hypothetical protein
MKDYKNSKKRLSTFLNIRAVGEPYFEGTWVLWDGFLYKGDTEKAQIAQNGVACLSSKAKAKAGTKYTRRVLSLRSNYTVEDAVTKPGISTQISRAQELTTREYLEPRASCKCVFASQTAQDIA